MYKQCRIVSWHALCHLGRRAALSTFAVRLIVFITSHLDNITNPPAGATSPPKALRHPGAKVLACPAFPIRADVWMLFAMLLVHTAFLSEVRAQARGSSIAFPAIAFPQPPTNNPIPATRAPSTAFARPFPHGMESGKVTPVTFSYAWTQWPVQIWCDDTNITFLPQEVQGRFLVTAAPKAVPGPHLVRPFWSGGCLEPAIFILGVLPELRDSDATGTRDNGLVLKTLPCVVNGQIRRPAETDVLLIPSDAGRVIRAEIETEGLDSSLKPKLEFWAPNAEKPSPGAQDDQDPRQWRWFTTNSGVHRLEISAQSGTPIGEEACYRATISTEQFSLKAYTPPTEDPNAISTEILRPHYSAMPIEPPLSLDGQIDPPGDEDRYLLSARGMQEYGIRVLAGSIGSPMVAAFKIVDDAGRVYASAFSGPDARLNWVAPFTGDFAVVITDAFRNGSPGHIYKFEVDPPQPHFNALLPEPTFRLTGNEPSTNLIAVDRPQGYDGIIVVVPIGIPDEVQCDSSPSVPGVTNATVVLTLKTNMPAVSKPVQFVLVAPSLTTRPSHPIEATITPRHARLGSLLINTTPWLWVSGSSAEPKTR